MIRMYAIAGLAFTLPLMAGFAAEARDNAAAGGGIVCNNEFQAVEGQQIESPYSRRQVSRQDRAGAWRDKSEAAICAAVMRSRARPAGLSKQTTGPTRFATTRRPRTDNEQSCGREIADRLSLSAIFVWGAGLSFLEF